MMRRFLLIAPLITLTFYSCGKGKLGEFKQREIASFSLPMFSRSGTTCGLITASNKYERTLIDDCSCYFDYIGSEYILPGKTSDAINNRHLIKNNITGLGLELTYAIGGKTKIAANDILEVSKFKLQGGNIFNVKSVTSINLFHCGNNFKLLNDQGEPTKYASNLPNAEQFVDEVTNWKESVDLLLDNKDNKVCGEYGLKGVSGCSCEPIDPINVTFKNNKFIQNHLQALYNLNTKFGTCSRPELGKDKTEIWKKYHGKGQPDFDKFLIEYFPKTTSVAGGKGCLHYTQTADLDINNKSVCLDENNKPTNNCLSHVTNTNWKLHSLPDSIDDCTCDFIHVNQCNEKKIDKATNQTYTEMNLRCYNELKKSIQDYFMDTRFSPGSIFANSTCKDHATFKELKSSNGAVTRDEFINRELEKHGFVLPFKGCTYSAAYYSANFSTNSTCKDYDIANDKVANYTKCIDLVKDNNPGKSFSWYPGDVIDDCSCKFVEASKCNGDTGCIKELKDAIKDYYTDKFMSGKPESGMTRTVKAVCGKDSTTLVDEALKSTGIDPVNETKKTCGLAQITFKSDPSKTGEYSKLENILLVETPGTQSDENCGCQFYNEKSGVNLFEPGAIIDSIKGSADERKAFYVELGNKLKDSVSNYYKTPDVLNKCRKVLNIIDPKITDQVLIDELTTKKYCQLKLLDPASDACKKGPGSVEPLLCKDVGQKYHLFSKDISTKCAPKTLQLTIGNTSPASKRVVIPSTVALQCKNADNTLQSYYTDVEKKAGDSTPAEACIELKLCPTKYKLYPSLPSKTCPTGSTLFAKTSVNDKTGKLPAKWESCVEGGQPRWYATNIEKEDLYGLFCTGCAQQDAQCPAATGYRLYKDIEATIAGTGKLTKSNDCVANPDKDDQPIRLDVYRKCVPGQIDIPKPDPTPTTDPVVENAQVKCQKWFNDKYKSSYNNCSVIMSKGFKYGVGSAAWPNGWPADNAWGCTSAVWPTYPNGRAEYVFEDGSGVRSNDKECFAGIVRYSVDSNGYWTNSVIIPTLKFSASDGSNMSVSGCDSIVESPVNSGKWVCK